MPKARLEGELSINNKPFVKGMNDAVAKSKAAAGDMAGAFSGIGGALAGALSIGAVAAFGRHIVDLGSELQDSSDKLNINVENLQGLRFAFSQSGTSSEQFDKAMVKLNQSMEKAGTGGEESLSAFKELGIGFEDLIGKSPEEVLAKIADGVKNANNQTTALSAVMELLGKSGASMVPGLRLGADGILELSNQAQKLSKEDVAALDDFGDACARLWKNIEVGAAKSAIAFTQMKAAIPVEGGQATESQGTNFMGAAFMGQGGMMPRAAAGTKSTLTMGGEATDYEQEAKDTAPMVPKELSLADKEANAEDFARAERAEQAINADLQKAADEASAERAAEKAKNQAEAAAIVRRELVAEMDGQGKLNELFKERATIQSMIATTGDASGELQIDFAKKSVEIAKQTRDNEKEKAKDAATAAAMAISAAAGHAPLTTGGLRAGGLGVNAHNLIRRGDAARARAEKAKEGKDPALSKAAAIARNTANLAKAFGVGGTEDL